MAVIKNVDGVFGIPTGVMPADYAPVVLAKGKFLQRGAMVTTKVKGIKAMAEINHGRWVVNCPAEGCYSAQVGDPQDPRYFCVTCGLGWFDVVYPKPEFIEALEELFAMVPLPENRNWVPSETIASIKRSISDHMGI